MTFRTLASATAYTQDSCPKSCVAVRIFKLLSRTKRRRKHQDASFSEMSELAGSRISERVVISETASTTTDLGLKPIVVGTNLFCGKILKNNQSLSIRRGLVEREKRISWGSDHNQGRLLWTSTIFDRLTVIDCGKLKDSQRIWPKSHARRTQGIHICG